MTRYAIGLGSNVGDRRQHLADACSEMGEVGSLVSVSPLYESAPVGGPDQDPFLNAVAVIESDLSPLDLLDRLHEIEDRHGRQRPVRWGPRTLDLDILASEAGSISGDRLTIPHERLSQREFALRPLTRVWPDALVGAGLTASDALERLDDQGVDQLATDWSTPDRKWKGYSLVTGQFVLIAAIAVALATDGTLPEGDVTPTRVGGAVVAMTGLILSFVSSRRLGDSMTASPMPRSNASLVTTGPYRLARHPIYGGLSLLMMGTALILDSVIGFFVAALLLPYFLYKAAYEERLLRMRFASYREYRELVTRRLIPFIL